MMRRLCEGGQRWEEGLDEKRMERRMKRIHAREVGENSR